jgi:nucleotide-binding universal stress UspA family protein
MFRTVLVPVDGSREAQRAVVIATDIAKAYGSKLHFLTVMRPVPTKLPEEMRHYLEVEHIAGSPEQVVSEVALQILDYAERHARKKGIKTVKTASEIGHPARAIMAYAARNKADLIVLGRRGLGALEGMLMGSVSTKVVSLADCPVLTVQ